MIHEESFGVVPLRQENDEWQTFLILHKMGNHWGFPKGHGNPGEPPLESARRELKEETNLMIVSLVRDEPFEESYTFRRQGKFVAKRARYYAAIVSGQVVLQTQEIRDGRWFSFKEAEKMLTFKEARRILNEIHKILT